TWFAGLFYLPRLFVYHAMSQDQASIERFKIMERKLFFGIMTPGGLLTLVFGFLTIHLSGWDVYSGTYWMPAKLFLIALLILYHAYCAKLLHDFRQDRNRHSHTWYRWFNEIPVILLIAIVVLAVVRPF
ncbi:MAG: CopD family protein, partial [Gammaproteobacteria bacterium]